MAHTDAPGTDKEGKGSSTFEADLTKAAKDSKRQDFYFLSLYQVNKFITYSDNEKCIMFNTDVIIFQNLIKKNTHLG